ncbi:MAG: fructosamine kinase family protein [Myxococcota bacterium]
MSIWDELEAALDDAVVDRQPVSGGDINEASRVRLASGRMVFVKHHPRPPRAMFAREAEGLAWLAEAQAVRTPEVLGTGDRWLALDWIERGRPARDHDEAFGRGLAALHRAGADGFGWRVDNTIGTLVQRNATDSTWGAFYASCRLEPLVASAGAALRHLRRDFERLYPRLDGLFPNEPPARLHGDLWGGNAMVGENGEPILIDPAVYGGHREMDLAMMELFGGFSPRVFAAYEEAFPTAPGRAERVGLAQLYPLLVHVNLFGGGYVGSVEAALRRYL